MSQQTMKGIIKLKSKSAFEQLRTDGSYTLTDGTIINYEPKTTIYLYPDDSEDVLSELEEKIDSKQDTLNAGENIIIEGNTISATVPEQILPVASKETLGVVRVWVEDDYLCFSTEELPKYSRVFAENTPEQISMASAEISKNGYTSAQVAELYGWNIGDTIPITLTTDEQIEMQIIGFNHDDKSDGSGKAGITLQTKDCLKTTYNFNSSSTNAGGWGASKMRKTHLPAIINTIPTDWKNIIKSVNKTSTNGGASNYSQTVTLSENLFLLSAYEVYSEYTGAQDGVNEGTRYEYYAVNDTDSAKIKKQDANSDGIPETAIVWWLRSCYYGDKGYIVIVPKTGSQQFGPAGISGAGFSYGVAFAFCV